MFNLKITPGDRMFSLWIRHRDEWTCVRCKTYHEPPTKALQCSHYFGRKNKATRFDPLNCDSLCYGCHRIWGSDDKEGYRNFKIKQLGQKGFDELSRRMWIPTKIDDHAIKIYYMEELKKMGLRNSK